ncbi:MAG: response regulator [Alphaproteobacteria bacterium]|nr:response regulator [Alphaproteobacteria bacterium]
MEILHHKKNHEDLVAYLPSVKSSLREWLFIDVRLTENSDPNFTINNAADLLYSLFENKEGKLYVCNEREILILIHWGVDYALSEITRTVERRLPEGSCDVHVHEPTPEGVAQLEFLITYVKPVSNPTFSDIRNMRREKVVLVADDDMYMRMLIKKGVPQHISVQEVADGNEVVPAYEKCAPDILLLDIHMPGMEGTDALRDILRVDPDAYVIMLSADSSRENVERTTRQGAKGFLAKPFTKEKLREYIQECPTLV